MCCEACPKYDKCEENDQVKDDCCSKCPDYDECVGMLDKEGGSFKDSLEDSDYKDYP